MVRAVRQGPPRRAGDPAADRVRAPTLRRGGAGPGRAGAQRGPAGLRPVRPARHGRRRAGFPGGQPGPAGTGGGGSPSAGSWPGAAPAGPALPTCCTTRPTLGARLWPQHPGPPAAAGRAAVHGRVRQPRQAVGSVSCPGCCRPMSASAVRAEHAASWTPTGSAPSAWALMRDGPALLAGLVACGRCGKKMTVRYQRGPAGSCTRPTSTTTTSPTTPLTMPAAGRPRCRRIRHRPAAAGDHTTRARGLLLAAAGQAGAQRAQVDRIWRQRLERARLRRQPGAPPVPARRAGEPPRRAAGWKGTGRPPFAERQRLGEEYDRLRRPPPDADGRRTPSRNGGPGR